MRFGSFRLISASLNEHAQRTRKIKPNYFEYNLVLDLVRLKKGLNIFMYKKIFYCLLFLFLLDACSANKEKTEGEIEEVEETEALPKEDRPAKSNPKDFEEIGGQNRQNQEKVETKAAKDTNSKVSSSELEELKKNLKKNNFFGLRF